MSCFFNNNVTHSTNSNCSTMYFDKLIYNATVKKIFILETQLALSVSKFFFRSLMLSLS